MWNIIQFICEIAREVLVRDTVDEDTSDLVLKR